MQLVQNNAARLVLKKKKRENVTPLLKKLHWLPIKFRLDYKLNLLTFKCIKGLAPKYLSDLLSPYQPRGPQVLRSSEMCLLEEKPTRLKKGDRAFSVAAPKLWNELPYNFRVVDKLCTFIC